MMTVALGGGYFWDGGTLLLPSLAIIAVCLYVLSVSEVTAPTTPRSELSAAARRLARMVRWWVELLIAGAVGAFLAVALTAESAGNSSNDADKRGAAIDRLESLTVLFLWLVLLSFAPAVFRAARHRGWSSGRRLLLSAGLIFVVAATPILMTQVLMYVDQLRS